MALLAKRAERVRARKQLGKLSRSELVQLIYDIRKDNIALEERCERLEKQLADAEARMLSDETNSRLTNIEGVLRDKNDPESLISVLTVGEADELIKAGNVGGGMIPKLQNCIDALSAGVMRVHILDGRIPHALLLEIFTNKGIGTVITAGDA